MADYNGDGRLDLVLGDYSDINWTRELNGEEKEAFQKTVDNVESLIEQIKKLQSSSQTDSPKYQSTVQQYMDALKEKKKFYKESRSASFIWLFQRADSAGHDPEHRAAGNEPAEKASDSAARGGGPVSVQASIVAEHGQSNSMLELSIQLDIEPDWHVYATVPKGSPLRVTRIKLNLPDGVEAVGDWVKPQSQPSLKDLNSTIYMGSATFVRRLKAAVASKGETIDVEVDYQVCNQQFCLPPKSVKKSVMMQPSR